MKGCIYIARGNELKLTLPGPSVTIKQDGTIWYQEMPLLGITDSIIKSAAVAAVKANRYDEIPVEAWTRLGDNPNGLWAGDDAAWSKHPAKLASDATEQARKIEAAKIVSIYLSSRGWGDYSSCNWSGDITRPDAEILAECKHNLTTELVVDKPDQSDAEILAKITEARAKYNTPREPLKPITHGPGYCYSCETYCYGDCGDYQPTLTTRIYERQLNNIAREADYGIND